MATTREQIERIGGNPSKPWQKYHKSRKWLKEQMNRFLRRNGKKIDDDESNFKKGGKPFKGYEY